MEFVGKVVALSRFTDAMRGSLSSIPISSATVSSGAFPALYCSESTASRSFSTS